MNIFLNEPTKFNSYMNQKQDNDMCLFDDKEAFMLGNLFKNLYMSYNGFSNYYFQPVNERQKKLALVQMYLFVSHEINLYLDTHPEDEQMVMLYNEYAKLYKEAMCDFENTFGPLLVVNSNDSIPFSWMKGPWPWQHQ